MINNIIAMDPLLLRRRHDHAVKYLAVCERLVRDFLTAHRIGAVVAEQTWAFELLVGQVCLSLGIPHLKPHTIRIPDPRFAFFPGHLETEILPIREPSGDDEVLAERSLAEFRQRRPQPVYTAINRSVLKPELTRLRTLTRHVLDLAGDPFDETSLRPVGLIADQSRQLARGIRHRRSRRFRGAGIPHRKPYVFFPLHKQPEASVDIKGSPFTGQLDIIRSLARTLPLSHDLYVKEHIVALNTRPAAFYAQLEQIPGVRLIAPSAEAFGLISDADLVVTITGTAAYEAALLRRPAATIAPIFFDRIVAYPRFDPARDSLAQRLDAKPGQFLKSDAELVAFLAWLLAQSFPGVAGDAFWQPDSMSSENITQVARGFAQALGAIASPPASR
jgi:hypothetical protein